MMEVIGLLSRYREEIEGITVEPELALEADLSSDILPREPNNQNDHQQIKAHQLLSQSVSQTLAIIN